MWDARRWLARAVEIGHSRRTRNIGIGVLIAVVLYGLAGFFGVPLLVRDVVAPRVATSLDRPLSVGRVAFNPYTLLLEIDKLRVGARAGTAGAPLADIERLRVEASWKSLVNLAPVINEVRIDRPIIHVRRLAPNRFNFSDLLESPPTTPAAAKKPSRFSISNIELHDGQILFDDRVLGQHHLINNIQIGIPFIANLRSDVDVYVQPLLQMVIDGSPLRVAGKAKPFANPPQSVMNLNLHRLNLSRFAAYLPKKLAMQIPAGTFSSALQLHFVSAPSHPLIRLNGRAAVDNLELRDANNAPLAELKHATVALTDVEPLEGIAHLKKIFVDGLKLHVVRNRAGTINFVSLMGGKPAGAGAHPVAPGAPAPPALPAARPSATAPAPAKPVPSAASPKPQPTAGTKRETRDPPASSNPKPPTAGIAQAAAPSPLPTPSVAAPALAPATAKPSSFDLTLKSFELINSSVQLTDRTHAAPATLAIDDIHLALHNVATSSQASPASFTLAAKLGGGAIAATGSVEPAHLQMTADVSLDQIDLPSLQAFAKPMLVASVASGKLSVHARVVMRSGGNRLNLQVKPADASINNFELRAPNESQNPLGWNRLSVALAQADLGKRQATVKEVRLDGLHLFAQRERNGQLSLSSLISRPPPAPSPAAQPSAAQPSTLTSRRHSHTGGRTGIPPSRAGKGAQRAPSSAPAGSWTYQIASFDLENARIEAKDESGPGATTLALAPFNVHLKNVSSDFAKPITLELDGKVNRRGAFKIAGNAALSPLKARLRIITRRIDLAMANPLVSSRLSATIKNAALSINGVLDAAKASDKLRLAFHGDALVGGVRMLDKVTNESFLVWNLFAARRIDFRLGAGPPRIHIAALALSDFYARMILNRDGRLNLRDIMARPHAAPTSLTRPTPARPPSHVANAAPTPITADIELGEITFTGGKVNYTDNFIQPNYTADLTSLSGKVGTFGSRLTAPAGVTIQGQINGNAPINISGSIDPLAPMASLDITAKAEGIELPNLTSYSTKYTGYPITNGTLTVDIHYLLKQQKLTAENHILIDQLTFGEKVDKPSVLNLPIRLAVALLKDPNGQIKLDIPISGSLSNPQFSIGGVIAHVLMNLVVKAATSPFSLLAAAVGGGGSNQDYNHVGFAPGWAMLTPNDQHRLDTLAKALQNRPAVKVTITGRVDPRLDVPGLREAMLRAAIGEQKIKTLGASAAGANPATIRIAPDEYGKYLWRAYKAADFAKPTNFIGMTKSVPQAEMKKLMLEHFKVTDEDLRNLANARAEAVRKELAAHVNQSRLSITAPKLTADGIKAGKTTRADLSPQ
jgi:Domain of Unknown Function (DUF748)